MSRTHFRSRAAGFGLAAPALLVALIAFGPSRAAGAGLPPYADASDPLATTPSTDDGSFGAWHNPAQWGVPERGFSDISWFDPSDEGRPIKDWALSFGRGLGVAVRRSSAGSYGGRAPLSDGLGSVTDWQIGLASGDGRRFGGLAYGFSGGGKGAWGRENYLSAGNILRPNRFVSTGLAGRWAPSSGATSGLLDLGLRPLGDPRLLLFADYAVRRGQVWTRGSVGGGVAVRPLPGLEAAVRFDDFERVRVNLGLTFLRFGARVAPRFDRGDHRGTWYSIRSNPPVRGFDVERRRRAGRTYLDLDLHGRAVYQSSRWFDDGALPLRDLTERIRFAKEDPTVGGVAIRLSGFQANISMLWELRQSLLALKASGKQVLIAADNLDQGTYYLACVADQLTIDPIGGLFIPGVQASRTYMKDLLGKLGIGFDEWRYFKYKSALETFSRTSFSDADREQFEALVRASYDELADGIAASGRTTRADFDRLVNEEPYLSAPRLKELGWVDAIGRWEDVEEAAKARGGGKPVSYESVRARRWQPDETWGMPPTIALVYLVGDCAMDEGIRARTVAPAMRRLRENADVDAVVLRVDSPGGDALASDLVAQETRRLRAKGTPTLVSQGRVAGSGGYWISMDGDEIAAGPFTITGSIGVIGGWVWNDGFGKKTGLASDHVQIGKSADLLGGIRIPLVGADLPERNLDEGERRLMKGVFEEMYGMFTSRVAAARGMEERRVRELGEGRIYDGKAALANGLVDRVATLEETIEAAKRRAGIAPDRRVRVVEVPPRPLVRLPSFLTGARTLLGGARDGGASDPPRTYEAGALQRVLDRPGRPLLAMPASLLPLEEEPVR